MTEQEYVATLDDENRAVLASMRQAVGERRSRAFMLLEGKVVETDMILCVIWKMLNESALRVGKDQVGEQRVSTVFLTVPHGPDGREHFETMVFGPDEDRIVARYETLDEAKRGHDRTVARLLRDLPAPLPDAVVGPPSRE
jgi:hypothetical protein